MKFKFEFTFEQAVLLLKLVDGAPHNQARPIVDHMISEITAQQDTEVSRLKVEDQKAGQHEQL